MMNSLNFSEELNSSPGGGFVKNVQFFLGITLAGLYWRGLAG